MKDKIIKRIIEVLIPLKTLYQEIDLIINDLENDIKWKHTLYKV